MDVFQLTCDLSTDGGDKNQAESKRSCTETCTSAASPPAESTASNHFLSQSTVTIVDHSYPLSPGALTSPPTDVFDSRYDISTDGSNTNQVVLPESKTQTDSEDPPEKIATENSSNDFILNGVDPANFVGKVLDAEEIKNLIRKGAFQPKTVHMPNRKFPKSTCGDHQRSFRESWYKLEVGKDQIQRNWLSYSPIKDAIFCHTCILFGKGNKEETFTMTGFSNWKKSKQRLAEHEQSQSHVNATIDYSQFCTGHGIDVQLSEQALKAEADRKKKIKRNRDVMERLTNIIIFLAEQGLALRGHREDITSEDFEVVNKNPGSFLALVNLLSKYDSTLASHLQDIRSKKSKKRKNTKEKKISGRGNLVSFMSAESQNKILNAIGEQIRKIVLNEVHAAGIYSIMMDCTTDVSHADQLSLILRYVNASCDVVERLLTIERVDDSTADGLFTKLQDTLKSHSVDLQDAVGQSYDGAAVMTGRYSGVQARIKDVNPRCLFVWTFDHAFNLVVMEACGSCLPAKNLFGILEKIYTFFSTSRKRSDVLKLKQKQFVISRLHMPQRVSTTRWWSHQKALCTLFFAESGKLFDCFVATLEDCMSACEHSAETVCEANALLKNLLSFEVILTAHVFNEIFQVTDPASLYLQSESVDLLTAVNLVEEAESGLRDLRDKFNKIYLDAQEFCRIHDVEGEQCPDEVTDDAVTKYRRETFIFAIDRATNAIQRRFTSHKSVLEDFSLLNPERFPADRNAVNNLRNDSFENAAKTYDLDAQKLRIEYKSFVSCYPQLKKSLPIPSTEPEPSQASSSIKKENFLTTLQLLAKYNLQSAFPSLYHIYKIVVTLPVGTSKCERSFSKLKIVKDRLRSTMGQQRLDSLLLINVERELTQYVDHDELIETYATSPLLKKCLLI